MPICEVCDRAGGETEVFFGFVIHTGCVPAHWVEDRREMEEFMATVRGS